MEFSPCGNYLLSGSRDRTWHLFKSSSFEKEPGGANELEFVLCANTDKKTSVHQRLIWTCCWSHNSDFFATGSRDKKVVIWASKIKDHRQNPSLNSSAVISCLGDCGMACQTPLVLENSVTALTFAKSCEKQNGHILAAGLESGKIIIFMWNNSNLNEKSQEWNILKTLDMTAAHHKTVKRLKFRPSTSPRECLLASCGEDNIVKIHSLELK